MFTHNFLIETKPFFSSHRFVMPVCVASVRESRQYPFRLNHTTIAVLSEVPSLSISRTFVRVLCHCLKKHIRTRRLSQLPFHAQTITYLIKQLSRGLMAMFIDINLVFLHNKNHTIYFIYVIID